MERSPYKDGCGLMIAPFAWVVGWKRRRWRYLGGTVGPISVHPCLSQLPRPFVD